MFKVVRRIFIFVSVLFFIFTMTNVAISAIDKNKKNETYEELDLFADSLAFVQAQYVDETKPKDLIYGAMAGMLNGLDPHSQFLTPEEYDELKIDTEGKFGGIGVEITVKDDLITIITAVEGTPAWEAGLITNDRIVKINDLVAKNFTLNEAVKKLRGEPGTEVIVVVWREKESKLYSFKIKRAIIDIKDIKESRIIDGSIGYIKLVEFRENTPAELDKALKALKEKGMDSLIFDLRNNPGGLLDQAVDVAKRFLPKDANIVSVRGRDEKQNADYKSDFNKPYLDLPIVVLVNEGSASGSEIVAGAFQDHKRAILLGSKTFGKGSVQTVLPLRDGSALKLTTSKYFTPSGRTIHEIGILPDIVVEQGEFVKKSGEEKQDKIDKIFEGVEEKNSAVEAEQEGEGTPDKNDIQLLRAIDLLKSLKIYKNILHLNE